MCRRSSTPKRPTASACRAGRCAAGCALARRRRSPTARGSSRSRCRYTAEIAPRPRRDRAEIAPSRFGQVLSGGERGELLLIVDCPSLAHVSALASHPLVRSLIQSARPLRAVAHLTPAEVAGADAYADWIAALPASTEHLILNRTPQPQRFAFVASARLQLKLHAVHGDVFPIPKQMPTLPACPTKQAHSAARMTAADMLCKLVIRPRDASGVCRADECRLLRWANSSGAVVSLGHDEIVSELR